MVANETRRFKTLDAMRGVAALIVAVFHFQHTLPWRLRAYCFLSGYLAVDLFFVLSGFVIALSYESKFRYGMTLVRFVEIRAIRLLPMVWVGATIGAVYLLTLGQYSLPMIAAIATSNAFLLPALWLGGTLVFIADRPVWSLFLEMVANVLYALVWRWLTTPVLVGIVLLSAIGAIFSVATFGSINGGMDLPTAAIGVARVSLSFFLGVLLWRTRDRWRSIPSIPSSVVLAALALALFPNISGVARQIYDVGFVVVLSPLLVMLGSRTEPTGRGVAVAAKLAAISYPLYAIHRPIQLLTEQLSGAAGVSTRIAAIVALVAVVPLSWWMAEYYDEPVRAWLRRALRDRREQSFSKSGSRGIR